MNAANPQDLGCRYCGSTEPHDRRRCRMRRMNADPEFAKAHSERMRRRHADPESAKAHSERASERMRRMNADRDHSE